MKNSILISLFIVFVLGFTASVSAQKADTFNIVTNQDTMKSPPTAYYGWGVFPADTVSYRKAYLNFTLGCGGGCSGWDYTVDVYLIQNTHHKDSTLEQGPSFTVNGNKVDSIKVKKDTTYSTYYDTATHLTDSVANTAYTIVQYKNCAKPTTPTDTVYWWASGYYNYYYNNVGKKIDSIFIGSDTSMYLTFCPYYSKPFDSLASYEIARMITPYGGYYAGSWTFPYRFDVTDFSSLLHDSVQIEVFYSGWTNQFTAKCSFELITGIPDHNPYKVINMWSGSFPYGSNGNPISNYLPTDTIKIDTGAYATRLRIIQTGHGEDNNNCTEFCANYQHVFINGTERFTPLVWRDDCGLNPLWHQGGTWLFDRANWCPGDLVNPYLDDLTPYVTRGSKNTIRINMDPYTSPNGGSIYIFGTSLVYYGRPNFNLDAAIEDIISPNAYAPYSRTNPACGSPEVVIRNTGATTLTSLTFTYGEVGAWHGVYTWNGNLPFDDTTLVYLPSVDLKASSTNKFEVTISNPNGIADGDQYADNNYIQVPYDTVPTYPSTFIIKLTTNLVGYQYSYFIEDANNNIIHSKSSFASSKTYYDTVTFTPGCYHFELDATGKEGLSFFANSNGNGSIEFTRITNRNSPFNILQADFGTSVAQNFNVGSTAGVGTLEQNLDYYVYPNPAKDELTLAGLNASPKDKMVRIYSSLGALAFENNISGGLDKYTINLQGFTPGIYCVIISNADGQVVKKVMVVR